MSNGGGFVDIKIQFRGKMSPCLSKFNNNSILSAITFFAKSHPGDVCGTNGLPLTPNSIAILGQFQFLKEFKHDNLCKYLDVIRDKHERTIIVSEYFGVPLKSVLLQDMPEISLIKIYYQIVSGLRYLNELRIVSHNLEPNNILIDDNYNLKLFNYGLYYMTNGAEYISFPIGNVRYMSPERILGSRSNIKSDIWSFGIIATELYFKIELWSGNKIAQTVRKVLSLCSTTNVLEKLAREHNFYDNYQNMNLKVKDLIESCLAIYPKNRPTPGELLKHLLFEDCDENMLKFEKENLTNPLFKCPLEQIYYWWQLAGGDVQAELKKEGLIRNEAPILSVPRVVRLNGHTIGPPKSQSYLYDNRLVLLKLTNLIEKLRSIDIRHYYPLLYSPKFADSFKIHSSMDTLPLVIREKDTEYQFHRTILFMRLLKGYPYTRDKIIQEAEIDIPPLLRGPIWAALLNVIENGSYEAIDKISPTITDRQIDVDVPRCHQYDEVLSSPEGHRKLKRLLKAWVTSHPQYVYWQGLDSLTAPFLYLNFTNEERAFLSLQKFIPKYLHWFFLKDNSAVIKEYLFKFSQLTAFHEPVLAKHLIDINFIPELYAIPWFLTMFSHVFPLHKIIHLWDKLILGDNSYPLFIGISILKQLKTTLLASGFNECILLFSDLPDIVMEYCVVESQKMYQSTPKSISYRRYVKPSDELQVDYSDDTLDIVNLNYKSIEMEPLPRISCNDFVTLLKQTPDKLVVIDLRASNEFKRIFVEGSINIPFNSIYLGDERLESLNVINLEGELRDKIIVLLSHIHENALLFSKFLIGCEVSRVCVLHKGFDILYKTNPCILKCT